ncbi:MAG: type IV pilin protein [Pseudomonadota bacterium]
MAPTSPRTRPQAPTGNSRRSAGFTLIELLIAVAIIGILASIAYPSYTAYVERSRLSDGQAGLMQAASVMERCYTENYAYKSACWTTAPSPEGVYSIELTDSGATFQLKAKGGTRVPSGCSTLWLKSDGTRGPDGCW